MNYLFVLLLSLGFFSSNCFFAASDRGFKPDEQSTQPDVLSSDKCSAESPPVEPSIDKLNVWLKENYGPSQLANRPERKFAKEFYVEADFNSDGCRDAAILIERISDDQTKLNENVSVISFDSQRIDGKSDTSKAAKKNGRLSLAIVFGDMSGWSTKFESNGKNAKQFFLLENIVTNPARTASEEKTSVVFGIVSKAKPSEDDSDLISLIPKTASGDCIYTAVQSMRQKQKFVAVSDRGLICFESDKFRQSPLPETKLYPNL